MTKFKIVWITFVLLLFSWVPVYAVDISDPSFPFESDSFLGKIQRQEKIDERIHLQEQRQKEIEDRIFLQEQEQRRLEDRIMDFEHKMRLEQRERDLNNSFGR